MRRRRHSKPLWCSTKIDKVRKTKKRCWYDFKQLQTQSDLLRYNKTLGTATKTIRNAMRSYKKKIHYILRMIQRHSMSMLAVRRRLRTL